MESVYEAILEKMLIRRGPSVERQRRVVFEYDGIRFEEGLRIDLLVEGCIVVELKSVEKLAALHGKQVLTYLKLMDLPVGLPINFGGATLKEGLRRIVNRFPADASTLKVNLLLPPRLRVMTSTRAVGYDRRSQALSCDEGLRRRVAGEGAGALESPPKKNVTARACGEGLS